MKFFILFCLWFFIGFFFTGFYFLQVFIFYGFLLFTGFYTQINIYEEVEETTSELTEDDEEALAK